MPGTTLTQAARRRATSSRATRSACSSSPTAVMTMTAPIAGHVTAAAVHASRHRSFPLIGRRVPAHHAHLAGEAEHAHHGEHADAVGGVEGGGAARGGGGGGAGGGGSGARRRRRGAPWWGAGTAGGRGGVWCGRGTRRH